MKGYREEVQDAWAARCTPPPPIPHHPQRRQRTGSASTKPSKHLVAHQAAVSALSAAEKAVLPTNPTSSSRQTGQLAGLWRTVRTWRPFCMLMRAA